MKKIIEFGIMMALTLVVTMPISAQRERTRTVIAIGSYVANQNETPAYGKAQALLEAKKQALREAGATEDVSSTAIIIIGGTGDEFKEINSELSRIELEGRVRVKDQSDAPPTFTGDGLVKYTTTIRAEVVVEETEEDLLFQFQLDGIRSSYLNGEKMQITITPTTDAYIRIFFFGKHSDSNAQLYPIKGIFKDVQVKAGETAVFPPEEQKYLYGASFEYLMAIDDEKDNLEQDVILIVALKNKYQFVEEVNYENVIRWLSKIKRNEKRVVWQGVNIVKN